MGVLSYEQQKRGRRACRVEGIRFTERWQADEFLGLKALERAGRITELKTHVCLPLVVNGIEVDVFVALFSYKRNGETVLVDSGWRKDTIKLQRKLVQAIYGITVTER